MKAAGFLFLFLATWLAMPRSAPAWADGGHKAVAIIAWQELGEPERAWVVSLLEQHPLWEEHFAKPMREELGDAADAGTRQQWLFAQAAVWPDIIRGPRGAEVNPWEKWHRPFWHYIDYPVFASEAARAALETKARTGSMNWQPGRAAFVEAKNNAVQTLKKALHEVGDATLPAPDHAVMLCWLFHLVGDLHQPCHAATLYEPEKLPGGDRGGNSTTIEGLPSTPLHAFWDDLLGGPGTDFADAAKLAADLSRTKIETLLFQPEACATDSNTLAKRHVYTAPVLAALAAAKVSSYTKNGQTYSSVTLHLSPEELAIYQKEALEVARQRGLLAGLRLAECVDRLSRAGK